MACENCEREMEKWRMGNGEYLGECPGECLRKHPGKHLRKCFWEHLRECLGECFGEHLLECFRKCFISFYWSWIVIDNKELSYTAEASLEKHLLSLRGNPMCSLRHSLRHFPMVHLRCSRGFAQVMLQSVYEAFSRLFLHSSFRVLKIASICQ